jgi:heme o synthase
MVSDVSALPPRSQAHSHTPAGGSVLSRKARAYVALTKPRVIELLLVTTAPVMILAHGGIPSLWLIMWTLVGGALSAGSANTYNMVIDRDIDAHMGRTNNRPLVTGEVTAR